MFAMSPILPCLGIDLYKTAAIMGTTLLIHQATEKQDYPSLSNRIITPLATAGVFATTHFISNYLGIDQDYPSMTFFFIFCIYFSLKMGGSTSSLNGHLYLPSEWREARARGDSLRYPGPLSLMCDPCLTDPYNLAYYGGGPNPSESYFD